MKIGLNVAATSTLDDYGGSELVRYPLWRDQKELASKRTDELNRAGILPLMVFDRAAITRYGWDTGRVAQSLAMWRQRFPNAKLLEAGNEPDGSGDSSSKQTKSRWFLFMKLVRAAWPNAFIVSGGLSGINFGYLDGIDDLPIDAVGFHPYAQDGESVKGLIEEIRKHTKKPLVASEFGQEYDPAEGAEHVRAEWLTDMLISLYQEGVYAACVYCGKMDQGTFGLQLADGTKLESWAAFTDAIPNLSAPVQ